jgi:DNA-binding transcriptional LysR family regulator
MMQIESRQLRQLVMLAKSGSFGVAARRLSLTEPALLRNVQTLERELGLRLFERRRGGVALTPAGEIIVGGAQRVVAGLESLRRDVGRAEAARRATLRVGASPIPRIRVLPIALARFAGTHSHVKVEVSTGEVGGFLRAVLREEIDLFVGDSTAALADPRFEVIRLKPERNVWVCRDDHPLAARATASFPDLAPYPLAVPTVPRAAQLLRDAVAALSWIRCDDVVTIRKLVLEGLVVGLLPVSFVVDDLAGGPLHEVAVADGEFAADVGAVVRLSTRSAEPLASLVEALRDADFGDLPAHGSLMEDQLPRSPSAVDEDAAATRPRRVR